MPIKDDSVSKDDNTNVKFTEIYASSPVDMELALTNKNVNAEEQI